MEDAKNETEWFRKCPLHDAKRNNTSFSFDNENRYHCFSCGAKGRGCIDFVMAYRKVNFQAAVEVLKPFNLQTHFEQQARKPQRFGCCR
jgi:DNA primase